MTHLSEEAIIGKQYVKTIWVVKKEKFTIRVSISLKYIGPRRFTCILRLVCDSQTCLLLSAVFYFYKLTLILISGIREGN